MATGKWTISPFEEKTLELLRAEVKKSGVSQARIVSETGIPKSSLSRMLSGKMQMDVNHLYQICQALDIPPSHIISQAEALLSDSTPVPDPSPVPEAREPIDPRDIPTWAIAAKNPGHSIGYEIEETMRNQT